LFLHVNWYYSDGINVYTRGRQLIFNGAIFNSSGIK